VIDAQFGIVSEVTYGTPVTVTRFYEFNTESIKRVVGRVESKGHRKDQLVARADRSQPYKMGAAGTVELDVPTKGFGLMLKHCLGGAAISTATDSNYTQTFTLAEALPAFTAQLARPLNDGTPTPWTYHGCKVLSLELVMDKLGKLVATVELDAEDEENSTGLATASYTSTTDVFSWAGGSATIDASSAELERFRVKITNPLRTDKYRLRSSVLKKEPTRNDHAMIEWELVVDHTAMTNYNKFAAAARADTFGALVATFDGPVAHAGTTVPRLEITIPAARFDAADGINVTDWQELTGTYTGIGTDNGSAEPITITYRTSDAAA
jgi:hypothetical protein